MKVTIITSPSINARLLNSPQGVKVRIGAPQVINVRIGGVFVGGNANDKWVIDEVPIGLINGINPTFFTQSNFSPGKLIVTLNGLTQTIVTDYQAIGNNTIQFNVSPTGNENILVTYIKQ